MGIRGHSFRPPTSLRFFFFFSFISPDLFLGARTRRARISRRNENDWEREKRQPKHNGARGPLSSVDVRVVKKKKKKFSIRRPLSNDYS